MVDVNVLCFVFILEIMFHITSGCEVGHLPAVWSKRLIIDGDVCLVLSIQSVGLEMVTDGSKGLLQPRGRHVFLIIAP